ncbi:MAG: class I SAM-dependent methyltransferase [Methanomassiliicoccus sp.]|nr:class I SAM-dependent methyltransferase [Methanomassiliicoccus sp.]
MSTGPVSEEQLVRQRAWLGDSWTWLLRTMILEDHSSGAGRPTALDVGCGPGLVMELLSPYLDVLGIDIDREMVGRAVGRGQRALVARAEELPFEDGEFDVVYCSFLLMWVADPVSVIREMARVSRDWIVCLAEPDHLGRISYPPGVTRVDESFVRTLEHQGADPGMGRRLQETFIRSRLRPVTGVHSSMWTIESTRVGAEEEWRSLISMAEDTGLEGARKAWDEALADGSLIQFNPVFFALARKAGRAINVH